MISERVLITGIKYKRVPLKETSKVDISVRKYPDIIRHTLILGPEDNSLFTLKSLPATKNRSKGLYLVELDSNFKENKDGLFIKVHKRSSPINVRKLLYELASSKTMVICYCYEKIY